MEDGRYLLVCSMPGSQEANVLLDEWRCKSQGALPVWVGFTIDMDIKENQTLFLFVSNAKQLK